MFKNRHCFSRNNENAKRKKERKVMTSGTSPTEQTTRRQVYFHQNYVAQYKNEFTLVDKSIVNGMHACLYELVAIEKTYQEFHT